jgi:hypothetical protein
VSKAERAKRNYQTNREKILARNKAYREANPDKMKISYRRNYLKKKFLSYGITETQYNELLLKQDGRCAICLTDKPTQPGWHIDHDHTTGEVRGILCQKCNIGIGLLQDNPAIVKSALSYLERS